MTRDELLKTAKPILFNTDMVRAILDGRKTVTRRCVKPKSKNAYGFYVLTNKSDGSFAGVYDYDEDENAFDKPQKQPAYKGDILYVRETWSWCPCWDCGQDTPEGCIDPYAKRTFNHKKGAWGCIGYKASFAENEQPPGYETWKPAIHMPKEAARIFLRVTDVRVERLQDMRYADCLAEGVRLNPIHEMDLSGAPLIAREKFAGVWDSTVKKSDIDQYGWAANPWVWVIEFERLEVQK